MIGIEGILTVLLFTWIRDLQYHGCIFYAATWLRDLFHKEVIKMLFLPKQEGQGLVEYALILVLVAIVVIVILAILGPTIGNIFSNIVVNI